MTWGCSGFDLLSDHELNVGSTGSSFNMAGGVPLATEDNDMRIPRCEFPAVNDERASKYNEGSYK